MRAHGNDVALVAAQRADQLLAEGDIEGQRVFMAIKKAIEELQRATCNEGEQVN